MQVPPFGDANVVMVQTPDWHSLALEADNTLWGWGANDHGQLGNGTTNLSVPVANWEFVDGLTEDSPGQFQFKDSQAVNSPQRFYCVQSP